MSATGQRAPARTCIAVGYVAALLGSGIIFINFLSEDFPSGSFLVDYSIYIGLVPVAYGLGAVAWLMLSSGIAATSGTERRVQGGLQMLGVQALVFVGSFAGYLALLLDASHAPKWPLTGVCLEIAGFLAVSIGFVLLARCLAPVATSPAPEPVPRPHGFTDEWHEKQFG